MSCGEFRFLSDYPDLPTALCKLCKAQNLIDQARAGILVPVKVEFIGDLPRKESEGHE